MTDSLSLYLTYHLAYDFFVALTIGDVGKMGIIVQF